MIGPKSSKRTLDSKQTIFKLTVSRCSPESIVATELLLGSFFIWFHIRSSHMIYFICIIHLHIFHGNIWTHNWPAPNVSGFIAQIVERRTGTGIARSRVQAPLKSWIFFFRLLYAIVKIAITIARIILHLISYPQFTYDLFHMHYSLRITFDKLFRNHHTSKASV